MLYKNGFTNNYKDQCLFEHSGQLESQQLRCNILANMGYYSKWDADFKILSSHNLYWRNQFTKFKSVKQRISKAAKPRLLREGFRFIPRLKKISIINSFFVICFIGLRYSRVLNNRNPNQYKK